jgi:hypothetical protein
MELRKALADIGRSLTAELVPQKDGSLKLEAVVAERKSFLSKRKLTYICRLRVDDPARQVRFFEMLKESGFGVGGGGDVDGGAGFGVKKEVYSSSGRVSRANLTEQSTLFGKDYSYKLDFGKFREAVRQACVAAGYAFEVKLSEKAV